MVQSERQRQRRRVAAMLDERSSWDAHYKELSKFFLPRTGRFLVSDRNSGRKRHGSILDNTGLRAVGVLAAGMQSGLTSPARPWLRLVTPDRELNKHHSARGWLERVTELMLAIFAKSNVYQALHQSYEEEAVYGTSAAVFCEDFANVVHMQSLTCGEYALGADWRGRPNALARKFECTVGALVGEFGLDAVTPPVQDLYRRGAVDSWVEVIHLIEPRPEGERGASGLARDMAWRSVYFEASAADEYTLRESGYRDFPAICGRWFVTSSDIYGISPGMVALGDAKQLQAEQLRKGQGIDLQTQPPVTAGAAYKNRDVDLMPGATNYDEGGTLKPVPLAQYLRLDHLLGDIEDVRQRIKSAFHVDTFLMFANLGADSRLTATEATIRNQEKLLMLGPVIERQHTEKLIPLVDLTFARMLRAGIVPPPPPELAGMDLQVEFISTIAQAQREVALNSVDRFVGNLGQIAAFAPGALDKFNPDGWVDAYADRLGIPSELIVPSEQVALIRQQRAQLAAQQQQADLQQQQASAMQALGNTPLDGGSALAALVAGGGLVNTDDPLIR